MPEHMQRRLIMLFCLEGKLQSLNDDEIAFAMRISLSELIDTKNLFVNEGLITKDWNIIYWKDKPEGRLSTALWSVLRSKIFNRDNYTCQYCGERGKKLECDHVMPISRGGGNEESNLVTACFKCNRSKRDKTPKEWGARHEMV